MNAIDFIVIIIIGFFLTNFSIEKFQEGFKGNKSIRTLNVINSKTLEEVTKDINTTMKKYKRLNDKLTAGNSTTQAELNDKLKYNKHSSLTKGPPVTPLRERKPKRGCPNNNAKINWPTGLDETNSKVANKASNDKDFKNDFKNMLNNRLLLLDVYVDALFIEEAGNVIHDNLQILTSGKKTQLKSI